MKQLNLTKRWFNEIFNYLLEQGFSDTGAKALFVIATLALIFLLGWILNRLGNFLLHWIAARITSRLPKNLLIGFILEKNAFDPGIRIGVAYVLRVLFILFYGSEGPIIEFFLKLFDLYMVFYSVSMISKIIFATRDWSFQKPDLHDKPLDSLAQLANIINYIFGLFLIYSIFSGNSINHLITALGAASAVLILVFRDTILGFVGSIQLSSHDMVKVGDWITVEAYDADGIVLEIGVTSVKVQNWDKTITTVPTSALVSDGFINWKGMQESGGRRIKRALIIRQASISFVDEKEIEGYKKIELLQPYLKKRESDIKTYNQKNSIDKSILINGRNFTNFGLFRAYAKAYINSLNTIKHEYTLMVRQLSPTEKGIPLEIYAFTNTINWTQYEEIMSDIFDHLIASVAYFNLEVFELPSGSDFRYFSEDSKEDKNEPKTRNSNPGLALGY
jgi:miniconductance mechanosensitive channel